MKFEEKLIELRKQKFLSQEELASALNVTRQTISKWELGQSKPDMDKLLEMSKFFEVGIEVLANDELDLKKSKEKKNKPKKERKYMLYILIVILIAAVATLVIRLGLENEKKKENAGNNGIFSIFNNVLNNQNDNLDQFNNFVSDIKGMYDEESEKMDKEHEEKVNEMENNSNKRVHNMQFESYAGTRPAIFVKTALDNVISNNKKTPEHSVTFVYNNEETTDETRIKEIKKSLDEWGEYEISIDYDENGYINRLTLE